MHKSPEQRLAESQLATQDVLDDFRSLQQPLHAQMMRDFSGLGLVRFAGIDDELDHCLWLSVFIVHSRCLHLFSFPLELIEKAKTDSRKNLGQKGLKKLPEWCMKGLRWGFPNPELSDYTKRALNVAATA